MKINDKGIALIKEFEGLRLKAYYCSSGKLSIAYGHTGVDVYPGMVITADKAELLLKRDLERFEDVVNNLNAVDLTPNQFSALVSLAYNIGASAYKYSTLLVLLNRKKYEEAADQFLRWDKGRDGKPVAGLTRRRKAERELFLSKE